MDKKDDHRKDDHRKDDHRKYACWLYSVPGIGDRTVERLLAICPEEEHIFREGEKLWRRVLTDRQFEEMREFANVMSPDRLWQTMIEKEIRFVLRSDPDYPARLREIPDPPYALYVRGQLPLDDEPSVAVVGARECSEYGSFVAEGIGKALGESGAQVISGMARGIDGISQRAALEAGGASFGVLGCGVDVCYPQSNRKLYDRLCVQGGLLSTYPPGTEARAQNFPPRNRIVSGLSDVLLVVEARQKSGTLITVDMALEQGKEVYVVPGRVTDRLSDGCNKLIKQGAGVFLSPEDFLRELLELRQSNGHYVQNTENVREIVRIGWKKNGGEPSEKKGRDDKNRGDEECRDKVQGDGEWEQGDQGCWKMDKALPELDDECRIVYDALDFRPYGIEELQKRLPEEYSCAKLMPVLMRLCVKKLAVQPSPGHFARRGKME